VWLSDVKVDLRRSVSGAEADRLIEELESEVMLFFSGAIVVPGERSAAERAPGF
jgi:hypothetical protein